MSISNSLGTDGVTWLKATQLFDPESTTCRSFGTFEGGEGAFSESKQHRDGLIKDTSLPVTPSISSTAKLAKGGWLTASQHFAQKPPTHASPRGNDLSRVDSNATLVTGAGDLRIEESIIKAMDSNTIIKKPSNIPTKNKNRIHVPPPTPISSPWPSVSSPVPFKITSASQPSSRRVPSKYQVSEHFRAHGGIYCLPDIPEVPEPPSTRASFETGDTEYFETRSMPPPTRNPSPSSFRSSTSSTKSADIGIGRAMTITPVRVHSISPRPEDYSSVRTASSATLVSDHSPPPPRHVRQNSYASDAEKSMFEDDMLDVSKFDVQPTRYPLMRSGHVRSIDRDIGRSMSSLRSADQAAQDSSERRMYAMAMEKNVSWETWRQASDDGNLARGVEPRRRWARLKGWLRKALVCGSARNNFDGVAAGDNRSGFVSDNF